jgi:uncharacterized protein (TIGR02452 family)
MGDNFQRRIEVWNDTLNILGRYPLTDRSVKHVWTKEYKPKNMNRYDNVVYNVLPYDCIDVAKEYAGNGFVPLVLNMADDYFPGGSVNLGSGAQEESIFRRSNICSTLPIHIFYPIKSDEAIYSPNVTVFKESESCDFRLYQLPFTLNFVSCPGLKHPEVSENGKLGNNDRTKLRRKIELICQIADTYDNDVLVLGALGCGAWRNPPEDVARVFKEVLDNFHGCFRVVVFAILPQCEKGYIVKTTRTQSNLDVFQKIFEQKIDIGCDTIITQSTQ